jgi:hypothetical protein
MKHFNDDYEELINMFLRPFVSKEELDGGSSNCYRQGTPIPDELTLF